MEFTRDRGHVVDYGSGQLRFDHEPTASEIAATLRVMESRPLDGQWGNGDMNSSRQPERTKSWQQQKLEDEAASYGVKLPDWLQLTDGPDLSGLVPSDRQRRNENELSYQLPKYSFINTQDTIFQRALDDSDFSIKELNRPVEGEVEKSIGYYLRARCRPIEIGFWLNTKGNRDKFMTYLSAIDVHTSDQYGGDNPFSLLMVEDLNAKLRKIFEQNSGPMTAPAAPTVRSLGSEYDDSVNTRPPEYDAHRYQLPPRYDMFASEPIGGNDNLFARALYIDRVVGEARVHLGVDVGATHQVRVDDSRVNDAIGHYWANGSSPVEVESQPRPRRQPPFHPAAHNAPRSTKKHPARAPQVDLGKPEQPSVNQRQSPAPARGSESVVGGDHARSTHATSRHITKEALKFSWNHKRFTAGSLAAVALLSWIGHNSMNSDASSATIGLNKKNATKIAGEMSKGLYAGQIPGQTFTVDGQAYLETKLAKGYLPQGTPATEPKAIAPYIGRYTFSLQNGEWQLVPKIQEPQKNQKGSFSVSPSKDFNKEIVTVNSSALPMTATSNDIFKKSITKPKGGWSGTEKYMNAHGGKIYGKFNSKDIATAETQLQQMTSDQVSGLGGLAVRELINQHYGDQLSKGFQPSVAEYIQTIAQKLNVSANAIEVKFEGDYTSALANYEKVQGANGPTIDKDGRPSFGSYRLAGIKSISVKQKKEQ